MLLYTKYYYSKKKKISKWKYYLSNFEVIYIFSIQMTTNLEMDGSWSISIYKGGADPKRTQNYLLKAGPL